MAHTDNRHTQYELIEQIPIERIQMMQNETIESLNAWHCSLN